MTLDLRPVSDPEARSLLEDVGLVGLDSGALEGGPRVTHTKDDSDNVTEIARWLRARGRGDEVPGSFASLKYLLLQPSSGGAPRT